MKYLLYKFGIPITIFVAAFMLLIACIIAAWTIPFYRMFKKAIPR